MCSSPVAPRCACSMSDGDRNLSWSRTESSSCQPRFPHDARTSRGEKQFRFGLVIFGAGADRGHDDHDCKFGVREVPEARKTVSFAGRVSCR